VQDRVLVYHDEATITDAFLLCAGPVASQTHIRTAYEVVMMLMTHILLWIENIRTLPLVSVVRPRGGPALASGRLLSERLLSTDSKKNTRMLRRKFLFQKNIFSYIMLAILPILNTCQCYAKVCTKLRYLHYMLTHYLTYRKYLPMFKKKRKSI
jgi:hypothetical protein